MSAVQSFAKRHSKFLKSVEIYLHKSNELLTSIGFNKLLTSTKYNELPSSTKCNKFLTSTKYNELLTPTNNLVNQETF